MAPFSRVQVARTSVFQPDDPSSEFSEHWTHPGDVFSVLLILGGDVVARTLAQLTGPVIGAPSFSFGWVAYFINALVSAVGENRLMPEPDCKFLAINGATGYTRCN
ncbi:hypothetical protein N7488_009132 [Penicillium malachiteum]|nr:hypothetical protein N7488_009132 [Penicillium malachiteum]